MPVPKRRVSKSRRNMRRAHLALNPISVVYCSNCQAPCLPHSVCESCGTYRGRRVRASFLNPPRHAKIKSSFTVGDMI